MQMRPININKDVAFANDMADRKNLKQLTNPKPNP